MQNPVARLFEGSRAELIDRYSSIMDPKTGMLAGLDCSRLRQDLDAAMKLFCVNSLNSSYYLRFIFAGVAFALLLLLCCGICTGARHELQEKM